MKQIVIEIEDETHIHTYEYEKFSKAEINLLLDLKKWLFIENKEEDNQPL